MKKTTLKYIPALLLALSSSAFASTFSYDPANVIIGEGNAADGLPVAPVASISTNFVYGLTPVSSAILTLWLSDDATTGSAGVGGIVDLPREWASFSLTDGANSSAGEVEVESLPMGPISIGGTEILSAAEANQVWAAGIENAVGHAPSFQAYSFDVTSLLQTGHSGSLGLNLGIAAKYADITPASDPIVSALLIKSGASNGSATVWEDYKFDKAELTVNYVPVPAAVWLFGSGLAGLFLSRKKKA